MNYIKKISKKIFTNKYADLVVILVVLLSVAFLAFENLSGFVLNDTIIKSLEKDLEPNKIEILKTIDGNKYSEDKLRGILETPWQEISETAYIYSFNPENVVRLEKILFSLDKNTLVSLTAKLKNTDFSEPELVKFLSNYDVPASLQTAVIMGIPSLPEKLSDKFSQQQLYNIKSLKGRHWSPDALIDAVDGYGFSDGELKTILNHTKIIKFTPNEISLVLANSQLVFPISEKLQNFIIAFDDIFLAFFIIELILRFFAANGWRDFLGKHWIDIIAIIPLLRVFRISRYFLLLRLIRPLAYAVLLGRHMSYFSAMAHRKWVDFLMVMLALFFVVTFGTIVLNTAEPGRHPALSHSLWTIVFSMLSNQYTDDFPDSLVGKMTILFTMIAGMGFFAVVIGAVSAVMIDKFKEGIIMKRANLELLEEHIIICGWQERTPQIITELHRCEKYRKSNIVVISHARDFVDLDLDKYGVDASRVYLLEGDFTDPEILKKANIYTASIAIILPDWSEGRTRRDVDARTVLASLTIEKLNGAVYSCAELLDQEYESHMEIGNVNEVIIGDYYNGLIMAHAAINQDLVPFIKGILPAQAEHKLGNMPMAKEFVGLKFEDAVQKVMASRKILPVGVRTEDGSLLLNPTGRVLAAGDYFVAILNKKDKSMDC